MLVRKQVWPAARAAERWDSEYGTKVPYTFHFLDFDPGMLSEYMSMGEPFWIEYEVDETICVLKEVELLERMKEREYEKYRETKLRIEERIANLRCIGSDNNVCKEASDF